MITAAIGKIFLDAYNEKYGTTYDAKTFFVEVYHPLFFNDNKYLMTAGNTPLENPKISWGDMISGKKTFETCEQRRQRLDKLMSKIEIGYPTTDNSVGFASIDVNSTTSGQTSNIRYPFGEDDIYYSWFGAGLGVGVQEGLSILFTDPIILLELFDGWKLYRSVLNANESLKGNQVNTWNGQWIAHRYDKDNFYPEHPMASFNPFETSKSGLSIVAQSWTKVLIGIARQFETPRLMGYVYKFDKTNTTIGFIPFNLEHIRRPLDLYKRLFGEEEGRKAEELWGTGMGFKTCCQKGAIGIEAMRPKDIEQYIISGKSKEGKFPRYDEDQIISFHTYQIWLLAMLNNEELWAKSLEFAKVLQDFVMKDKTISTKRKIIVESVLTATSRDKFISSLKELLPNDDIACINDIAKIVLSMPDNNLKLFLTLIGFHYAVLDKQ